MDFLLCNGLIVTVDRAFRVLPNGWLAVRGGEIVGLGDDLSAAPTDLPRIDVEGQAVLPGLINCHTHLPMSLFRGIADDKELMDWLQNYIFPAESQALNAEFVRWGTRLSLWEMLRGGITTVVDMYMFEAEVAAECARLGMRGVLGQSLIDFPTPDFESWDQKVEACRDFVRSYGRHPLITPGLAPHSPYTVSPEHLKQVRELAEELNCPVIIHLAETRAEHDQVLAERGASPVTYLDSLGLLSRRMVAAHVVWPDQAEIELLARRGVGVGHCPQSNAKLASGIAPVVRMIAAGVAVGLGTDGAASNNDLDMWQEMQTANFLQKLNSQSPTVMSARQTLELATREGARAAHLDHLVGSLEVGKRADLITVRLDSPHQLPVYEPVSQLVYTTRSSDVTRTWIDGKLVMDHGRVPGIDEAELRGAVGEQKERVQRILKRI